MRTTRPSSKIEGDVTTLQTTKDLFEKDLHAYTITHAIEDRNVLRFHVDYYRPKDAPALNPGETLAKQAVAQAILDKHDFATGDRRFNALLATASINDAIEYYKVFKQLQPQRRANDPEFVPLKVAAVFSPPAEGNKDVRQIQEDLPQEKEDNRHDPEGKKTALKAIIADYNQQYRTSHDISNFDLYYQDIQQRIKDQQFPNRDLPHKGAEKIDITIVVEMLLTGFDAVYLNTLYVDKSLKHHGLIQAFSRTNRVLNATKPFGHILDFRQQQDSVDAAIALFSGAQVDRAREIWLVDKAPVVIDNFKQAVNDLGEFMQSQGLEAKPDQVNNLKGDDARAQFIKRFREVQRLQTQLEQYTDLTNQQREQIDQALPRDGPPRLPRRLPRNRPAPEGAAAHTRRGPRAGQRRGRPARLRVRPLRLCRHRLRLHHEADGQVLGSGPEDADDQPRAAYRADPVRRQVPRRTGRDHRVRPLIEGGRGPRRGRHPAPVTSNSRPRSKPKRSPISPGPTVSRPSPSRLSSTQSFSA